MANKKINYKNINDTLDTIDASIDNSFKNTYNANTGLRKNLDDINDGINDELNKFTLSDNSSHVTNVTQLYNRINIKNGGDSAANVLGDNIFDDTLLTNNILESQTNNRYIQVMNNEYDTICKYMPKMKTAIQLKKDNVLSADNFGKKCVTTKTSYYNDKEKVALFNQRCAEIIKKYHFEELCDEMVDDGYTYGEYFLYNIPYKQGLKKLLDRRNIAAGGYFSTKEQTLIESGSISSKSNFLDDFKEEFKATAISDNSASGLKIVLHRSGLLEDAIENRQQAEKSVDFINESYGSSVYESSLLENAEENTVTNATKKNGKFKTDNIMPEKLEYEELTSDGLIGSKNNQTSLGDKINIKVPGYILRKLKPENILLLYIEDVCLGYYYVELDQDFKPGSQIVTNGNMQNVFTATNKNATDEMMKFISDKISKHIDSNFINSNTDLSKEIYMILKYNDTFNVTQADCRLNITFIPADDVLHFKFETDKKTHRGVSSIAKGIMPAKLWICITYCNAIGMMTRGQDRRVYYVKQQVEQNVSKSLINVINQIKKGNFGVRQMESINNMMGILGRFQEFVVPVGPNGDSPVQFEIMPGQDIKVDQDFLSSLEDQAIGVTDVPLELVNAMKGLDYAVHYSMTNVRFLKVMYKDQKVCENAFSTLFTRIYNSEYQENIQVDVVLPPPSFLTYTNGSQFVDNVKNYINAIAEVELADETDDQKKMMITKRLFEHYLSGHFEMDIFEKIKDEASMEIETMRLQTKEETKQ